MKSKRKILLIALVIMITTTYYANRSHVIAEKVFYQGNGIELKMITAYENLLFHFTGNTYQIQCKSEKTQRFKAQKFSKSGWNNYLPIPNKIIALRIMPDSEIDIEKLASVAKESIKVTDSETLMINSGDNVFVSWDGCKSFMKWSQGETIPHLDKNYQIEYSGFHATKNGFASFNVEAKQTNFYYKVSTSDYGKNWNLKPLNR